MHVLVVLVSLYYECLEGLFEGGSNRGTCVHGAISIPTGPIHIQDLLIVGSHPAHIMRTSRCPTPVSHLLGLHSKCVTVLWMGTGPFMHSIQGLYPYRNGTGMRGCTSYAKGDTTLHRGPHYWVLIMALLVMICIIRYSVYTYLGHPRHSGRSHSTLVPHPTH